MVAHPDAIARIDFLSTEQGGRQEPTPANYLACILSIGKHNFDVRLLLNSHGAIAPGDTATVGLKFLDFAGARDHVRVGAHFELRDSRKIAAGRVIQMFG